MDRFILLRSSSYYNHPTNFNIGYYDYYIGHNVSVFDISDSVLDRNYFVQNNISSAIWYEYISNGKNYTKSFLFNDQDTVVGIVWMQLDA